MSGLQTVYTTKKEKLVALTDASEKLEKTHGAGSIMRLGSRKIVPVNVIPTNVFELDHRVLGVGGVPRGRITEIYGPESSGKTTWALQLIASAQSGGGMAAYIDAEHALDVKYAKNLGVDTKDLFISQPDFGEQALEITEGLIETGAVDIVVVDSVSALVPKAELDGEMSDQQVGLQARLMSKAMRKLIGVVRRTDTCLIFINQIREKIGVTWGSPETTSGGRALKFAASIRLDIRRIAQIKEGESTIIGDKTKIKCVKNKVASPKRECEVDLIYGSGIDKGSSLISAGLKLGTIEKSGAWFNVSKNVDGAGERIGQGARNAAAFLMENTEMWAKVSSKTLDAYRASEAEAEK